MLDKFSNYKRRILSRPKILSDNIWWLFILISIVFITVYFLKRLEHSSLLGSAFFLVALLGLFIILKKPFWGLMATYLIYSFNLSSTTEEHVIKLGNIGFYLADLLVVIISLKMILEITNSIVTRKENYQFKDNLTPSVILFSIYVISAIIISIIYTITGIANIELRSTLLGIRNEWYMLIFYFLILYNIKTLKQFEQWLNLLVAMAIIGLIPVILFYTFGPETNFPWMTHIKISGAYAIEGYSRSVFAVPIVEWGYNIFPLTFMLSLVNSKNRILYILSMIISGILIILCFARTNWVSLCALFPFMIWFVKPKLRLKVIITAVVVVCIVLASTIILDNFIKVSGKTIRSAFIARFLSGLKPQKVDTVTGRFEESDRLKTFIEKPEFLLFGYNVVGPYITDKYNAHMGHIDTIMRFGVIGTICWLILQIQFFSFSWKLYHNKKLSEFWRQALLGFVLTVMFLFIRAIGTSHIRRFSVFTVLWSFPPLLERFIVKAKTESEDDKSFLKDSHSISY